MNAPMTRNSRRGFTLVEVLVALAIVAITLIAGLQASAAMTRNGQRQADRVLAQLCAENTLAQIRLSRQLPDTGERTVTCEQGGRTLTVTADVQPTPNPNFRRVQARVSHDGLNLLQLTTVIGRF